MKREYMRLEKKPKLKKTVTFLKAAAVAAIVGVNFSTIKEVAKEVYEGFTTQNNLVDLDYGTHSVVLYNKDSRTPEQIFLDIETRILEMESLEKAFGDTSKLTQQEKEDLIQQLITVIADEANISTDELVLSETTKYAGYYTGKYERFYTTTPGKIFLNDDAFIQLTDDEELSFRQTFPGVIKTAIHEMIHAVEFENIMRGKNVTDFDRKIFDIKLSKDYETSFVEINAQLVADSIYDKLCQKYMTNYNKYETSVEYGTLPAMLRELYLTLYDVDASVAAGTIVPNLPEEIYQKINNDPQRYMLLTAEELILKGFEKKLQNSNLSYDNIDIKETYYYTSFIGQVPSHMLKLRAVDIMQKNYSKMDNIEYKVSTFENTKSNYPSTLIAKDMSVFLNNLRYYYNEFNKSETNSLIKVIENNIARLSEEDMNRYALKDYEEIILSVEQNQTQTIDNDAQSAEPEL